MDKEWNKSKQRPPVFNITSLLDNEYSCIPVIMFTKYAAKIKANYENIPELKSRADWSIIEKPDPEAPNENWQAALWPQVKRSLDFKAFIDKSLESHYLFVEATEDNISLYASAMEIAQKKAPVLIQGETGTGKEFLARTIHQASFRHDKPFKAIDCATIPKDLFESELFGHEKNAFTGASSQRIGKFESANGGTIFLDEIGELPLLAQAKLLRVLQEEEIERIGGTKPISIDIRIISATNRDLEEMIENREFREDLFYRIQKCTISIKPLRKRKDEIPNLAKYLWDKVHKDESIEVQGSLSSNELALLKEHRFDGNIRELGVCRT